MSMYILAALCGLTLLAYLFDLTGRRTRVPGIILLLAVGNLIRQFGEWFSFTLPDLQPVLPVLGTTGLILIVLEGSMDLELTRERAPLLRHTFFSAVIQFLLNVVLVTAGIIVLTGAEMHTAFINAVPLGIISSAIAISSVFHLPSEQREFVVYESSFSDILGILAFNFLLQNDDVHLGGIVGIIVQFVAVLLLSAGSSLLLGSLLQRIAHSVKFIPIIAILILLYTAAKGLGLPSLVLIMVFGLFLNNIRLLDLHRSRFTPLRTLIDPPVIMRELVPFRQLVAEVTFVVRSFFFLIFGYATDLRTITDPKTAAAALAIVGGFLLVRLVYFRIMRIDAGAVLFVAPRGLITILLFLGIPAAERLPGVGEGLLSQVIILSALVMMFGLMGEQRTGTAHTHTG